MMVLQSVFSSGEIRVFEDWDIIRIVGSKAQFEGVSEGDVIEYVPSWSEYKLSDLDREMYDKGFRFKRILVMKNNEGIELVNELMSVTLDTATPISEGKMRDDCGDLRFYWWNGDSQAWEEISYWIDNDTVNSGETKVILRIPRVEANDYVNIVVYYGAKHYGRKDDLSIAYGARAYEGKYLSFDGVDDYATFSSVFKNLAGLTIAVKARIYKYDDGRFVSSGGSGMGQTLLWPDDTGLSFMIFEEGVGYDRLDSNQKIYGDVWVVGVYDGTNIKIYANGSLIASATVATVTQVNDSYSTAYIGRDANGFYTSNEISKVLIWNRALTDTEITDIMSGKVPSSGLVLNLDDSGISGSTWTDSSGNGNNATLYGNPTVYKIGKMLSFDGVDDEVRIDFSEYVDTFEGGISNWAVVTKTSDSVSNVTQSSDYRHDGSYSARFEAYLDGISTNGYDWNDMRQSDYMDWSDCVGVGFWIYVPDSSVGVNAVLEVGFYDSDGTEIWKHGVMRFSDVSSGWYYVEIYKDELDTPVGGDEVINWQDSRLSIRIHSSDSSLDGTTVVVYIDEVKKLRMDKRTYTIISYHKIREDTNEWTTGKWRYWVVGTDLHNVAFMEWGHWVQNQLMKFFYEDGTNITSAVSGSEGMGVHMSFIRKDGLTVEQGVFDKGLNSSLTLDNSKGLRGFDRLRIGLRAPVDGIYYFVYNRYVDDTELQTIYENPNDPPRAGLVLWLAPDSVDDVNGKWLDKSGLGNDGTIYGAQLKEVRTFESMVQTSKVMSFDGVDDYVEISGDKNELMVTDKFTLVASFRVNALDRWNYIVSKRAGGGGNPGYGLLVSEVNTIYGVIDDGSGAKITESSTVVSTGQIYDVAYVRDGDTQKIYVKGVLEETTNHIVGDISNTEPFLIGVRGGMVNYYNGLIRFIMLYNRPLTDIEIQQIYNDPNNPPLDGLVLWLDGTSIDETNGKWLNKAPALKSGYIEPLDGVIYGASPSVLLSSVWSEEVDMNNGVKIVWRGKVVKKVVSGNSVVLYVRTNNLGELIGEVV